MHKWVRSWRHIWLNMKEHFLYIVFDCTSLSCRVFYRISVPSWSKNWPMIFFPQAFSTILSLSSGIVVFDGCWFKYFFFENREDNQSIVKKAEEKIWENFYTNLTLKYKKKTWLLEKLQSKIINKKCSIMFNSTWLRNNLQPNYKMCIYICTHTDTQSGHSVVMYTMYLYR